MGSAAAQRRRTGPYWTTGHYEKQDGSPPHHRGQLLKMGKTNGFRPIDVRDQLVEALRLDLIGPENGSELETEVLPQAPSRWYLTGFLVPL